MVVQLAVHSEGSTLIVAAAVADKACSSARSHPAPDYSALLLLVLLSLALSGPRHDEGYPPPARVSPTAAGGAENAPAVAIIVILTTAERYTTAATRAMM